jgi:hypothetical protein
MEHPHRCVYCHTAWSCYEDCPFAGASVCERCRDKLCESPDMPLRVIPLRDRRDSWVFDRLTEYDAERIRQSLRRDRPQ